MGRAGIEQAREFDIRVIGEKLCTLVSACLQEE
jgi:hypothetical protein